MGLYCIYNLNYIFSFLLQRPSPDRSDILFIMEAEAIEAEIYKKIKRIAVNSSQQSYSISTKIGQWSECFASGKIKARLIRLFNGSLTKQ